MISKMDKKSLKEIIEGAMATELAIKYRRMDRETSSIEKCHSCVRDIPQEGENANFPLHN